MGNQNPANWAYDKTANELQFSKALRHKRRRTGPKISSEEVAKATELFLLSGGHIEYLEPSDIPLHLCSYEIFI